MIDIDVELISATRTHRSDDVWPAEPFESQVLQKFLPWLNEEWMEKYAVNPGDTVNISSNYYPLSKKDLRKLAEYFRQIEDSHWQFAVFDLLYDMTARNRKIYIVVKKR